MIDISNGASRVILETLIQTSTIEKKIQTVKFQREYRTSKATQLTVIFQRAKLKAGVSPTHNLVRNANVRLAAWGIFGGWWTITWPYPVPTFVVQTRETRTCLNSSQEQVRPDSCVLPVDCTKASFNQVFPHRV